MRLFYVLVAVGVLAVVPVASFATPVAGTFDIGGSNATVAALFLNFACNPAIPNAPCPAPADYGNFTTTNGTNDFAPYTTQGGYVHNLSQAAQPVNTSFLLPDFIMFSGTAGNPVIPPDIALDLSFIFLGVSGQAGCAVAPAPGQICTPVIPALVSATNPAGLSPYNLQNTQTGSTASFSVAGTARRISTAELSNFQGVFTAQFTVPYQTLLADLTSPLGPGTITNSYSATFVVTPIPEPGTMSLAIGGLLIFVGGWLRKISLKA